jgi:glutamate carboxypeptidase
MRNLSCLFILTLLFFGQTSFAASEPDLDLLKSLVAISSDTKDMAGVNEVQNIVSVQLKALGFVVRLIENPKDPKISGKMLVAEWPGQTKRFITLVSHADTVFEKLNAFKLSADGKTASGSGVIDNKGGIVVGIHALGELIKANPKLRYSLRIVISPSEETGSVGFGPALMSFSNDSIFLIGLEPGLDNGSYVSSRKGVRWYDIHVFGKESHAGAHHEDGINACYDLSVKLSKIQMLTDYEKGNTVSIGSISGGKDKFNIVCGEASAKVDTRFATPSAAKELFQKIEAVLNTSFGHSAKTQEGTVTKFTNPVDVSALPEKKAAHILLQKYVALISQIEGRTIHGEGTGGVADLNQMFRPGLLLADGMGPLGGGVHTADEFLTVSSLHTRAEALSRFLQILETELK